MIVPVIMPRQGQSVESCIITMWYKSKGDTVSEGDVLFSYETDKASFEEESGVSGILVDIFYNEGEEVPVLHNVCAISTEGGAFKGFEPIEASKAPAIDKSAQHAAENKSPESIEQEDKLSRENQSNTNRYNESNDIEEKLKISPRAKNLSDRLGVDPLTVGASGPEGRIIERDIAAAYDVGAVFTRTAKDEESSIDRLKDRLKIEATGVGGRITTEDLKRANAKESLALPESSQFEEIKLSNIRKVIANAMQTSLSTIPQLTLQSSFDATDMLALRKKLKNYKNDTDLNNITINDMILFAVSRTIPEHKNLNSHLIGDTMRTFKHVHLGIAVDTEKGLMVPTIFNADLLSLVEISRSAKDLARKCIDGTIKPDLLKGASFTITNLGLLDIEYFTPVINPPQAGILGVGSIMHKCIENNGNITYYPSIGLSLTFDHRALDGAPAARFLKHLKTNLENFSMLLVK